MHICLFAKWSAKFMPLFSKLSPQPLRCFFYLQCREMSNFFDNFLINITEMKSVEEYKIGRIYIFPQLPCFSLILTLILLNFTFNIYIFVYISFSDSLFYSLDCICWLCGMIILSICKL